MTPDKLVEELDRMVQGAGPVQRLGAADPQPHRHAGHRHQEPGRREGGRRRPGDDRPACRRDRTRGQERARRQSGAGRTPDRRPLYRRRHRPRRGRALRPEHRRVQIVVSSAMGGENIGEMVEGLQRFPINVRYPREMRDSLEKLRTLPIVTERGAQLAAAAMSPTSAIADGPPMLRSENARLSGWVYVDMRGRDLRSAVRDMQAAVAKKVTLPPGYSVSWSGQFEYLERATERLKVVVPATLADHFRAAVPAFRRVGDALLIMATLPFALVGGFWLLAAGAHLSVATAVGFIALAGVPAEFGVIMLLYLSMRGRRAGPGQTHEATC